MQNHLGRPWKPGETFGVYAKRLALSRLKIYGMIIGFASVFSVTVVLVFSAISRIAVIP